MNREEEIDVMSKKDNPHTERLELAKHLQGLSEEEYNYTVNTVDNDRRNWECGAWYGAHWADNHPSTELIKKVAEQILMFNHITPDCWSQWMADGCVEQIKKNLER